MTINSKFYLQIQKTELKSTRGLRKRHERARKQRQTEKRQRAWWPISLKPRPLSVSACHKRSTAEIQAKRLNAASLVQNDELCIGHDMETTMQGIANVAQTSLVILKIAAATILCVKKTLLRLYEVFRVCLCNYFISSGKMNQFSQLFWQRSPSRGSSEQIANIYTTSLR